MHLPTVCLTIRVNNQSVKEEEPRRKRQRKSKKDKESQRKTTSEIHMWLVRRGHKTWLQIKSESKAQKTKKERQ